ncbi:MAG: CHASE2 domain-containing protein [Rhizobacter sp.]
MALPPMRRAWPALVALLAAVLVAATPLFRGLSDTLDDTVRRLASRPSTFGGVLVIDIDDVSLHALQDRLGPWPYRRDIHALLLDYLRDAGARAVAFDVVFDEARDGDALLAKSLARRPDVVLGMAGLRQELDHTLVPAAVRQRLSLGPAEAEGAVAWSAMTWPTPTLLTAMTSPGGLGMISTPLEPDRRLRKVPLLHDAEGYRLPSLPLALFLVKAPPSAKLSTPAGAVELGAHRWPVDRDGRASVLLPANATQVPTLLFRPVIEAALGERVDHDLREAIAGRTVFVGSSAFLGDEVLTPHGVLPGTAVLANVYDAMARGDVARAAPWPAVAGLVVLALLPVFAGLAPGRPLNAARLAACLVAPLLVLAAAFAALRWGRMEVPMLPALVAWVVLMAQHAAHRARALSLANRRLAEDRRVAEAANAAKSEFLANVSHELRTPLNAVLGMAEVLLHTPLTEEQRRYVTIFQQSGESLTALIDDLLDLSKIEANRLQVESLPFSVRQLTGDVMALLGARARNKDVVLEHRVDADVHDAVTGDARRLTQVLVNLLGNAVKFTHEGRVDLRVRRGDGQRVVFEVNDTGIGIAAAKLPMIFEPFVQADPGMARRYGGTGLGLAITRRLVELMGGHIEVRSTPGRGSTFEFDILLPPAPAATEVAPVAPDVPAADGVAILLAEDNDVNITVVEAMLQRTPHTIHVAGNGEVALSMFRQRSYGLVLMDIQMPGMDGLTATRELRRFESAAGVPRTAVVALTANAFAEDEAASHAAGCDGHLVKPLARQRLLEVIATHGRPGPARERAT